MCIKGEKKQHLMYVYKWSQDLMYKNNVSKQERKEKIQSILTTSLNKKITLLITKMSNSPPKNDYSHKIKILPLFVTNDKG